MFHEQVPSRTHGRRTRFSIRSCRLLVRLVKRNSARLCMFIILIQIIYISLQIHTKYQTVSAVDQPVYIDVASPEHRGINGLNAAYNDDYDTLVVPKEVQGTYKRRATSRVDQTLPKRASNIKLLPLKQPKHKPARIQKPVTMAPRPPRKITTPYCSMEERTSYVKSYCAKTDTGDSRQANYMKMRYGNILVDEKHKVMFCDIPNVEGALWGTFIARVTGGATHPHPPVRYRNFMNKLRLHFLDFYSNEQREKMLKEYFKFVVVRHPLERLLLMWREKLVRSSPKEPWRNRLGKNIILEQRGGFHDIADIPSNITVKFEEFLEYAFANRDMIDPNWFSYLQVCHACEIQYDAILKSESMDHDAPIVLERYKDVSRPEVRLNYSLPIHPELDILTGKNHVSEYDPVSQKALEAVITRYDHDMKMFGYKWHSSTRTASCGILSKSGRICC